MEVKKYQQSISVTAHIKHDLRRFTDGKASGNEDIVPQLSKSNYSLIERGSTCLEVNTYRKNLEKSIFSYNRKNVVHAVEWVVQLPADCPKEQEDDFFREVHNFLVSTLPMGEKCVIVSEVHKDERHYAEDGTLLSKDHLHFLYVPAVPDTKHKEYQWKLCADQLTKRKDLKKIHPDLQKHLDQCGIKATVYKRKTPGGKTLSLSVDQLKYLTAKTGKKLDHNHQLTLDEITTLINKNILKGKQLSQAQQFIKDQSAKLEENQNHIHSLESKIKELEKQIDAQAKCEYKSNWGNIDNWGTTIEEDYSHER